MLSFKDGVRVRYFDERIALVLRELTIWSTLVRVDVHVSSIDDGDAARLPTTLHGKSLAVDLNVLNGKDSDRGELADWLRVRLPPGYDIVFETDHVHVEVDAHRPPLRQVPTPTAGPKSTA